MQYIIGAAIGIAVYTNWGSIKPGIVEVLQYLTNLIN